MVGARALGRGAAGREGDLGGATHLVQRHREKVARSVELLLPTISIAPPVELRDDASGEAELRCLAAVFSLPPRGPA